MAAAAPQYGRWLNEERVHHLEDALSDPDPVRQFRTRSLDAYNALPVEPNPLYRGYANLSGADLTHVDLSATERAVPLPSPDARSVRIVHDSSGTRVELPAALTKAGVTVRTLPELWNGSNPEDAMPPDPPTDKLHAFALATLNRVVHVDVPDRCALPVRVQDITVLSEPNQGLSVYRRVSAGRSSRLLYTEELYATAEEPALGQRLYSSVTDASAADDSAVRFLTVHAPDPLAVSVYQRHAKVGARGRFAWVWSGFGGLRTRMKNLSQLVGNGSQFDDLQTFYGQDEAAYDSSMQITHQGTDTHGQSVTRGLFRDRSRGVSRGLVRIEKEARKTLSFLSEHAMLLSKGASSETIPILEILCRDVKATHSSSVAPVDPEKIFYLGSRGFSESESVRLIGEGFLSHVLERAPIAELRERLYPLISARWERRPVRWGDPEFAALPPLTVRDESAPDEWRFDAKLR